MKKPKMTITAVKKAYGVDVPAVVAELQKHKNGALIISASGETIELEYLRAAMPTMSGLIVGVITDPLELPPILTGRQAHEAIATARQAASIFKDRPTKETLHALQVALSKIERTLT